MAEQTPDVTPPAGDPATTQPVAAESPLADAGAPAASAAAAIPPTNSTEPASLDSLDQVSIEELLKQASFEDPSASAGAAAPGMGGGDMPNTAAGAEEFKFPGFQQALQDAHVSSIDLLRDVELNVKIELGRSRMLVEDVLKLSEGSVVELDKLAGDPVDVFVNDRLVARGEVLVLNDNFCVRVNEIVAGVKEEGN
jgi:flagellar motor switch protein FliN/FliY